MATLQIRRGVNTIFTHQHWVTIHFTDTHCNFTLFHTHTSSQNIVHQLIFRVQKIDNIRRFGSLASEFCVREKRNNFIKLWKMHFKYVIIGMTHRLTQNEIEERSIKFQIYRSYALKDNLHLFV